MVFSVQDQVGVGNVPTVPFRPWTKTWISLGVGELRQRKSLNTKHLPERKAKPPYRRSVESSR